MPSRGVCVAVLIVRDCAAQASMPSSACALENRARWAQVAGRRPGKPPDLQPSRFAEASAQADARCWRRRSRQPLDSNQPPGAQLVDLKKRMVRIRAQCWAAATLRRSSCSARSVRAGPRGVSQLRTSGPPSLSSAANREGADHHHCSHSRRTACRARHMSPSSTCAATSHRT